MNDDRPTSRAATMNASRLPQSIEPRQTVSHREHRCIEANVDAALAIMNDQGLAPRGHDSIDAAVQADITATVASYEAPTKYVAATTQDTTVAKAYFNTATARNHAVSHQQHFLQLRLRQLQPEQNIDDQTRQRIGYHLTQQLPHIPAPNQPHNAVPEAPNAVTYPAYDEHPA